MQGRLSSAERSKGELEANPNPNPIPTLSLTLSLTLLEPNPIRTYYRLILIGSP